MLCWCSLYLGASDHSSIVSGENDDRLISEPTPEDGESVVWKGESDSVSLVGWLGLWFLIIAPVWLEGLTLPLWRVPAESGHLSALWKS